MYRFKICAYNSVGCGTETREQTATPRASIVAPSDTTSHTTTRTRSGGGGGGGSSFAPAITTAQQLTPTITLGITPQPVFTRTLILEEVQEKTSEHSRSFSIKTATPFRQRDPGRLERKQPTSDPQQNVHSKRFRRQTTFFPSVSLTDLPVRSLILVSLRYRRHSPVNRSSPSLNPFSSGSSPNSQLYRNLPVATNF